MHAMLHAGPDDRECVTDSQTKRTTRIRRRSHGWESSIVTQVVRHASWRVSRADGAARETIALRPVEALRASTSCAHDEQEVSVRMPESRHGAKPPISWASAGTGKSIL